jgi:hypothetical protein
LSAAVGIEFIEHYNRTCGKVLCPSSSAGRSTPALADIADIAEVQDIEYSAFHNFFCNTLLVYILI